VFPFGIAAAIATLVGGLAAIIANSGDLALDLVGEDRERSRPDAAGARRKG